MVFDWFAGIPHHWEIIVWLGHTLAIVAVYCQWKTRNKYLVFKLTSELSCNTSAVRGPADGIFGLPCKTTWQRSWWLEAVKLNKGIERISLKRGSHICKRDQDSWQSCEKNSDFGIKHHTLPCSALLQIYVNECQVNQLKCLERMVIRWSSECPIAACADGGPHPPARPAMLHAGRVSPAGEAEIWIGPTAPRYTDH
jgi:hypothetical protein